MTSESKNIAILAENLHKYYPVFQRPGQKFKYLIGTAFSSFDLNATDIPVVKALDGIDVTVRRGDRVGIIGRNGAGKSTLLQLIAGGFPPTAGKVNIQGGIYSLLPGSSGFEAELSARENAKDFLTRHGIDKALLKQKIAEIEEFVELGDYFDQPVKTYSLGMRVRTEFAAATALSAEILIIDEVLGAGDIYWSEKTAQRMDELCADGRTLLLVSHSIDQILRFCNRCLWIEKGRIVMDDDVLEVTKRYEGFLEGLSWKTEDVDDKQLEIADVVQNLGNVTLEESGQGAIRWPGKSSVLFSGIWINEQATEYLEISENEDIRIRMKIASRGLGDYRLKYLLTFWSQDGRRIAILENWQEDVSFSGTLSHTVEVEIPAGQLGIGTCFITFSLFDLNNNETTEDEHSTRLDLLYKSLKLSVKNYEAERVSDPIYRIELDAEVTAVD